MKEAVITARAVTKNFQINNRRVEALRDVSFEVRQGEWFGIVGANGSGKTTLLRLLAGIYKPDTGTISVQGRVASLFGLGLGFHPDLSAYDNLFVNGLLLGLPKSRLREHYRTMVDFAELEGFMETPLRYLSSGMRLRLAFTLLRQIEADVYLFDEVLAVGDAVFVQKCLATWAELKGQGKTCVLVSHNSDQVRRFCDRTAYLDKGRLVEVGKTKTVLEHYTAELRHN